MISAVSKFSSFVAWGVAGAKTVISSLWKVRDDSTRKLMLHFYDGLWNRGEGKLEALRGAQLEMLRGNRERYGNALSAAWGAFVCRLTGAEGAREWRMRNEPGGARS